MNSNELTREQISSVPCPSCLVAVGKGCVLYLGGLRSGPHLVRKLSAIDALERKRAHLVHLSRFALWARAWLLERPGQDFDKHLTGLRLDGNGRK